MAAKGTKRVQQLRRLMKKEKLDAFIIKDRNNTRYLSGFRGSFSTIVVDQKAAYFLTDSRYTEVAEVTLGKEFHVITLGGGRIAQDLKDFFASKEYKTIGFEESISFQEYQAQSRLVKKVKFIPAGSLIQDLRIVKDEGELVPIKKAVRLADKLMARAIKTMRPGMRECDLSREIRYWTEELGGEGESFSNIVASGPNSSRPHHHPGTRKFRKGDAVTVDLGAIVDGYCSDLTRTVVIGEPKKGFRDIYDVCLAANEAAIAAIKPGMTGIDVDLIARQIIAEAGYGDYFGHGLGHGVGVEIHEAPRLSPAAPETKLKAGMIVTIEPGIYLPGKFGVRIEDYVHLTKGGAEVLSKSPKKFNVLNF